MIIKRYKLINNVYSVWPIFLKTRHNKESQKQLPQSENRYCDWSKNTNIILFIWSENIQWTVLLWSITRNEKT
jgi:hypothetical protein